MNLLKDRIARERIRVREMEQIYAQFGSHASLFSWAAAAFEFLEPDQMWRGLWLLRRLARTRKFSESEMTILAGKADLATHWTARLYLCQLLAITGVPESARDDFFPFLRQSFADRRQIIRAWAISALVTFKEDARFRSGIAGLLRQARRENGKAMQARLRQLGLS